VEAYFSEIDKICDCAKEEAVYAIADCAAN